MGTENRLSGRPPRATLAALGLAVLGLHAVLLDSAARWSAPGDELAQPLRFQTSMLAMASPASPTTPPAGPQRTSPAAQPAPATPGGAPASGAELAAVAVSPGIDEVSTEAARPPADSASAPASPAAPAPDPAAPATSVQGQPPLADTHSVSASAASTTAASAASAASAPSPATAATTARPASVAPESPLPVTAAASPTTASTAPPPSPTRITATAPPASVRLKYRVEANRFPFSLSSELSWQQDGQNYQARLEFSALGQSRVQTSRGLITPGGLAPLRFSDKYRTEVAAHFNREQGKVTFSANTPDIALLPGAQDRLSVLIQLAALLAGERAAYTVGSSIAIQTIGPRDADTWLFSVEADEVLQLPGGEQATLKLLRKPRAQFDQRVELWLAPALGYLPVRVRITEANGDALDQKWLASETLR
jgi:Protein of unknown function (DUF3108)